MAGVAQTHGSSEWAATNAVSRLSLSVACRNAVTTYGEKYVSSSASFVTGPSFKFKNTECEITDEIRYVQSATGLPTTQRANITRIGYLQLINYRYQTDCVFPVMADNGSGFDAKPYIQLRRCIAGMPNYLHLSS